MIDAGALLGDLQAELGRWVDDLTARVGEEPEVRERLEAEWRRAFEADRTGRTFEQWLEDRLTQVAVGWILACVFVRFAEDNGLVDAHRLAGPGEAMTHVMHRVRAGTTTLWFQSMFDVKSANLTKCHIIAP